MPVFPPGSVLKNDCGFHLISGWITETALLILISPPFGMNYAFVYFTSNAFTENIRSRLNSNPLPQSGFKTEMVSKSYRYVELLKIQRL
jgi:hypothetical protein